MKKQITIIIFLIIIFPLSLQIKVDAASKTLYGKRMSFTMQSSGATDIKVSCSESAEITIYKKNFLTKKQISHRSSATFLEYTARLAKYSNTNKYYVTVKVRNNKRARVTCTVKQHMDKKKSSLGGIWTPYRTSPVPSSGFLYNRKIYFTSNKCSEALTYVSSSKYLDYQSKLANGTITATGLLFAGTGIKSMITASTFLTVAQMGYSFDFKSSTMDEIKRKGNYNKRTNKFRNGVVLLEVTFRGVPMIKVEKWTGNIMTGAGGYVGYWK
ncbi:MAG: hypothetical protein Q4F83_13805 [Eubacteriales bacterium]|nr:hypothetical protein [Eubacteriales bacterium]